jgi:hypothetical protein
VLVDPATAFAKILGDLLGGHDTRVGLGRKGFHAMDNRRLEYGGKMGIGYPAFLWEDQQMGKKKPAAVGQDQRGEARVDREEDQKLLIAPFEKVSMDVSAVEAILEQQVEDLIDIYGKKKFKLLKELDQKLEDLKDDLKGNEIFEILYAIFNKIEQQQDDEDVVYLGKRDSDKEEAALQNFLKKIGKKFGKINKHDVKRYAKIKDIQSSKDVAVLIFSTFGDIRYILDFSRQIGITSAMVHLLMDKRSALDELNESEADFFRIISKHFASLSGMIEKQSSIKDDLYEEHLEKFVRHIENLGIEVQDARFKDVQKYCKSYNEKNFCNEYCEETGDFIFNKKIYFIKKQIEENECELKKQELRVKDRIFSEIDKKKISESIEKYKTKINKLEIELERKSHGLAIMKALSPATLFKAYRNKYKKRSSK